MLTIFANMRINDKVRLQHMKDSFASIKDISDDWVINVRGSLRNEAINFLKKNLGDKLTLFELLDDERGWNNNALDMIDSVGHDYLIVWIEDHVNIAQQNIYKDIVREMSEQDVGYMLYTWWMFGKSREVFDKIASKIGLEKFQCIDIVNMTKNKWKLALKEGHPYFVLSLAGIYKKELFKKMLIADSKKLPIFLTRLLFKIMGFINIIGIRFNTKNGFDNINRIFFNKLRKYPKVTPFELEKPPTRTDVFPLKMALSKQELFVCIDDDLDIEGYSLVSRGLYKEKFSN